MGAAPPRHGYGCYCDECVERGAERDYGDGQDEEDDPPS